MKSLIKKIFQMTSSLFLYYICLLYVKLLRINNPDVWLVSEMGTDARDNGWHFYDYLKKEHPEINVKYIIQKKSQDLERIAKEDRVYFRSINHYILFLTAGKLISSHVMGFSPEFSLFTRLDRKKLLKTLGKRVFLQHGITKDYIPNLTKERLNVDLFICGAKPEYDYILKSFGFDKNVVKYTGFARFDKLKDESKNQILVMPTWRKNLKYEKNFKNTQYYRAWQEFLSNKCLHEYLEDSNIKLIFYPHYEIQKYINCFKTNCKQITLARKKDFDIQTLLRESKVLITDYSSVYFDFAYMRKPVIYYHFDYDDYRAGHYSEGYFDYKEMGFGPVVHNEEDVVRTIIDNSGDVCLYKDRIDAFFPFKDKNNSERIYTEIVKLK